jgi:hypothetical protein
MAKEKLKEFQERERLRREERERMRKHPEQYFNKRQEDYEQERLERELLKRQMDQNFKLEQ